MNWIRFSLAVLATSLLLVAALVAIVAFPARTALASTLGGTALMTYGPWSGSPWHSGAAGNNASWTLPPELQGLADVPADQRFGHFVGVQVSLKDKNGSPLVVDVTPGKVSAASATSLTLVANDGTSKTFALDAKTMVHGQGAGSAAANAPSLANGDSVVIVTLNQSTTAMAVMDGGAQGFNWTGPHGPMGPAGSTH
jgi:hypothetical protein